MSTSFTIPKKRPENEPMEVEGEGEREKQSMEVEGKEEKQSMEVEGKGEKQSMEVEGKGEKQSMEVEEEGETDKVSLQSCEGEIIEVSRNAAYESGIFKRSLRSASSEMPIITSQTIEILKRVMEYCTYFSRRRGTDDEAFKRWDELFTRFTWSYFGRIILAAESLEIECLLEKELKLLTGDHKAHKVKARHALQCNRLEVTSSCTGNMIKVPKLSKDLCKGLHGSMARADLNSDAATDVNADAATDVTRGSKNLHTE